MSYRRITPSSPPSAYPARPSPSRSPPSSASPSTRTYRASPSVSYTDSDPDENFPPSISQRYPQALLQAQARRSPLRYAHAGQRNGSGSGNGEGERVIDMRSSSRNRHPSGGRAQGLDKSYGSSGNGRQESSSSKIQASPKTIYGHRAVSVARSDRCSASGSAAKAEHGEPAASGRGQGQGVEETPYDTLLLPNQSEPRGLKQKRSFERTKAWAAGLDLNEMVDSEGAGSLTSDDASHGSSSILTPRTPRCPSPASDRAILPALPIIIAPDPLPIDPPTPPRILSIDELVRKHSAGIDLPMSSARDKARKELGLGPSPVVPRVDLPLLSPGSMGSGQAKKLDDASDDDEVQDEEEGGMLRPPDMASRDQTPIAAKASARASSVSLVTPRAPKAFRTSSAPGPCPLPLSKTPASPASALSGPMSPTSAFSGRSGGTASSAAAPSPLPIPIPEPISDAGHELALHLRSEQLNKFFIFPRPFPHHPLRVSYAEVGKPDGYPVFFFLGLGCVRYLIALYDEFAQAFGLRVICVDRWGYGKTDQVEHIDRGLVEWSTVMGQVCKELKIEKCQIVAHSAGAPYALAMARRWPEMVRGKVHLLAPWVGQEHENVSKWLKWVPGSIIKTATRADHRLHTMFIGKAPKLGFKPVAFDKARIAAAAKNAGASAVTHTSSTPTARPVSGTDQDSEADAKSIRSRISASASTTSKGGKQSRRPSRLNMREPSSLFASASGASSSKSIGKEGKEAKSPTGMSFMHRAGSAFMRAPSSIYGSIGAASSVSLALSTARAPDAGNSVDSNGGESTPPGSPVVMSYGRGGFGNKISTPKSTTPSRTPRKSTASDARPSLHLGRSPALHNLWSFSASNTDLVVGLGLGMEGGHLAPSLPTGASATALAARQSTDSLPHSHSRPSIDSDGRKMPKGKGLRIGSRSRSGPIAKPDPEDRQLTTFAGLAEAEFAMGGFDTMGTDLQLALPESDSGGSRTAGSPMPNKASMASLPPYLRDLDGPAQVHGRGGHHAPGDPLAASRSRSTVVIHPSASHFSTLSSTHTTSSGMPDSPSISTRFIQHHLAFHPNLPTAETEARYPSSPEFALALEQASHAECEPGTTADVLRVIVNRPYRSFGFLYENIPFKTHVWWGTEDRMISEKSIKWMKDKCGSEVTIKMGVAHGMLSDGGVVGELFSALGEEARGNWS